MNSSSESENFDSLENRDKIFWLGLPLDVFFPLQAGNLKNKKQTNFSLNGNWKLLDFYEHLLWMFYMYMLHLLICYLFDECPYLRYLKDSGGSVYTPKHVSWVVHQTNAEKSWGKFVVPSPFLVHIFLVNQMNKVYIPFFDEAWAERGFTSVICSMKKKSTRESIDSTFSYWSTGFAIAHVFCYPRISPSYSP